MSHGDPSRPDPTEAPRLISDAISQFSRLIQSEISLAKREVSQNLSRAGGGIVMIVVAIILALTALDVLAAAAVAALVALGLSLTLASLVIGGTVIILAIVLVLMGKSRLSPGSLTPDRAVRSVRKDIQTLKENANV